ncbi:NAD(P)H-dependent oxidoreductase [Flavisphingomonas formosensis]|uniref:NAD(P)H-dependent oxidoreductase n=1 Tax=Flavisphingomonas formosensis TaxID=861534 RepID=UPI0012FABD27|nr:NAD(P)H-dependent oxidoreductase [Sphingomonas formosensis]
MRLLLILAHPVADSFAAAVAETARATLTANGHEVDWLDLYGEAFEPCLSAAEHHAYFREVYDIAPVASHVARLRAAEGLILVFPTWWFGFPAMLKGYFDRVLVPDVAFTHNPAGGIVRGLTNIHSLYALTTTGSPFWLVRFVLGDPVRRVLKWGIAPMCAKGVRFRMLSLHDMDRASEAKRRRHLEHVRKVMGQI